MVDGAATLGAMVYGMRAAGEWSRQRGANMLDSGAHFYDTYRCADGQYVLVAGNGDSIFRRLMAAIGRDELGALSTGLNQMLERLIGRQNVLTFLQADRFVSHAVATVDNLARPHAPVTVWPVSPTPQRFTTLKAADGASETIHPDNAARYTPFVRFVEAVDSAQAVALYRRLYPLFQAAYEELGFPGLHLAGSLVATAAGIASVRAFA